MNCRTNKQQGLSVLATTYLVLITAVLVLGFWLYNKYSYSGEHLVAKAFEYPSNYSPACSLEVSVASKKTAADHLRIQADSKLAFSVTTPNNYRGDYAHPLLVVWAPSGFSEGLSERFTGLTGQATELGYVVVYVRSMPLSQKALGQLATVPSEVSREWCIDESRVFYTGHSDGGTVSNALTVMTDLALASKESASNDSTLNNSTLNNRTSHNIRPQAIAPSAMGMQGKDMAEFSCPQPTAIMLMHNRDDTHFPNFGESVIEWWAQCNQCSGGREAASYPLCEAYTGCAAPTLFCQAEGGHAHWPGFEHRVLDFFNGVDISR